LFIRLQQRRVSWRRRLLSINRLFSSPAAAYTSRRRRDRSRTRCSAPLWGLAGALALGGAARAAAAAAEGGKKSRSGSERNEERSQRPALRCVYHACIYDLSGRPGRKRRERPSHRICRLASGHYILSSRPGPTGDGGVPQHFRRRWPTRLRRAGIRRRLACECARRR